MSLLIEGYARAAKDVCDVLDVIEVELGSNQKKNGRREDIHDQRYVGRM
jgi:hypothetical protein